MWAGLHFVVSTDLEKPDANLRKLIRSHVMQGKNRGKTHPHRARKRKGVLDAPESLTCLEGPDSNASSSGVVLPILAPRRFGSELSTICFPDGVEPKTVEVVLQFSLIAKQVLFALEPCILFERRAEDWVAPLVVDPAFLHTMIFMAQYYFDVVVPGNSRSPQVSHRALPHFLRTVKLLRDRFDRGDDQARLSFPTIAAIMGLAGHAHMTGDARSARNHMSGLHKITRLKGGVAAMRYNTKLLVDILRADLGIALHSGPKPAFFNDAHFPEPFPSYPDLTPLLNLQGPFAWHPSRHSLAPHVDGIDNELAQAWRTMSEFCSIINFAVDSRQLISTEGFLDTMAPVMYRLLDMAFEAGSSNEAIRLGLLAFSSSTFLQWKYLGGSYAYLSAALRECLAKMAVLQLPPKLVVWLIMAGAVSVLGEGDDGWLKPLLLVNIGLCDARSWGEMRDILSSLMWIGMLYDKAGKGLFDSIVS
ncbi:hypothetical protein B0T25DRAFT_599686 [Lasiosphaeria hispida]|uniref:Uncharacterized protein n=1 Tax=Lasiosphaeria hispida TaxID=260671 RepID=A0AAJ0HP83_9PEZI|nr:hypothetical protein B0T25DRAFT_599686 [Lasiosphaeria hispida]